ncbi:hypothetical protein BBJ28_00021399 [Nothophytophthora sp. Chile5]|nr:hypothetical protein BBJ28_00021399 [Nothophytophthora sp. Chile5]
MTSTSPSPPPPPADAALLASAASADASFDAYAWAEEALSSRSDDAAALSALLPPLSLRSQALARGLHASLAQLALSAPQLQARVAALQQATAPLGRRLDSVYAHAVGGVDSGSSTPEPRGDLSQLAALHAAKQRLQSCAQALVEAAKWGRNVRTVVVLVEDPARLTARADATLAPRVREMRASLEVLRELPGAWDREQTLARLSAQIEAAVKPKLAACVRSDDAADATAALRWCLDVLASVDRAALVRDEFCRARPAAVHRLWFAHGEADTDTDEALGLWLDGFYARVLQLLQHEMRVARDVFGAEPLAAVLLQLLHDTLTPLAKSFRDRLAAGFSLQRLLSGFRATRSFAGQLLPLFRELESASAATADQLLRVVFEPFRGFFVDYNRFASDALTDALLRLVPPAVEAMKPREAIDEDDDDEEDTPTEDGALQNFAQRVEDAAASAWALLDESLQQCHEFSGGAAFPEAVEAVGAAVQQFTLALSATLPAIRQLREPTASAALGGSAGAPDWRQFHAALALLTACGALESDLCALDGRVRVRMRQQLAQFLGEAAGPSSPRSRRKKSVADTVGANVTLAELADPSKLVAAVAKIWLHDEPPARQTQFHQFELELLAAPTSVDARYPTALLLDEAQRALRSWAREAQLLTYDAVFLPIARVLETLPSNENWRKVPDATLGDLPTFSLLPQDYITLVADLLLSLLPQLEPFAESGSLQRAVVASRGAHESCVASEWARLGQLLHLAPPELAACQRLLFSSEAQRAEPPPTATQFVDLWTATVASGTLAALLRAVCSISTLSELGARQLSADLAYFHNVLSAVGGEGNWLVDDLRRALDSDPQAHAQHADELRAERDSPEKQALAKINACLAGVRQRPLWDSSTGTRQGQRSGMATIYFYYNELLRQSEAAATQAQSSSATADGHVKEPQQDDDGAEPTPAEPAKTSENQDEESSLPPSPADSEAELAALQPRMNRLAYLQTAVASNLDALARALGPKE